MRRGLRAVRPQAATGLGQARGTLTPRPGRHTLPTACAPWANHRRIRCHSAPAPIRAGLNELRPGSLHVGFDIQARVGAAVYAIQPGVSRVLAQSGPNARVQVGNYIYWHMAPRVRTGELVTPFETVLGTVVNGYGHIAFSELGAAGQYVNPLRPGGRVLEPYVDRAPPAIGAPALAAGGQVIVPAYSPQTFVQRTTYTTPVLAPAAIAYRLYDPQGDALTPLEWAFRGTHLLAWAQRSEIYAPGARSPGFACFATRSLCVPRWIYRVAGGLAPPLPSALAPGPYRLTIYAWDWADNKTALDTSVTMTATGWRPIPRCAAQPSRIFHPNRVARAGRLATLTTAFRRSSTLSQRSQGPVPSLRSEKYICSADLTCQALVSRLIEPCTAARLTEGT
jgi:hypothetical protein